MIGLLAIALVAIVIGYPASVGGHWITADEYNAAVQTCADHGGLQWANTVVLNRVEFICHDELERH